MAKRKAPTSKACRRNISQHDLNFINEVAFNQHSAMREGPKVKRWTRHDIKQLQPLNAKQTQVFRSYYQGDHILMYGSAGTGKTMQALFLAINDVVDASCVASKIKIVRSAVQTRDQGHLPGTLEDKNAPYENAYRGVCTFLCGRPSTYDDMKAANIIEFITTGFLRGETWDDTIVIVEEAQNMTFHEIDTIMTRVGTNSRVILTGDTKQCDLSGRNGQISGFGQTIQVSQHIDKFSCIQFTAEDNVRSGFSRDWLLAVEKAGV